MMKKNCIKNVNSTPVKTLLIVVSGETTPRPSATYEVRAPPLLEKSYIHTPATVFYYRFHGTAQAKSILP